MAEDKKQEMKKTKPLNIKITGLDIDNAEYQEIVLSNSNNPDRNYSKNDYYN